MDNGIKSLCKRCLLEDLASKEYLEQMKTYIEGLGDDIRAEEKLYRKRLSACKGCDNLIEGICRICGCFVEYRAAIKIKSCPDHKPRW